MPARLALLSGELRCFGSLLPKLSAHGVSGASAAPGDLPPRCRLSNGGPSENALTTSWPLGRGKNRGGRVPPPSKWLGPQGRHPGQQNADLGTHSPYRNADLCPPVGFRREGTFPASPPPDELTFASASNAKRERGECRGGESPVAPSPRGSGDSVPRNL